MIMPRKKMKPALEANENPRAIALKKEMLALVEKVKELTILCDVQAMIMFIPKEEVEPMVWPSVEGARELVDHFFALSDFEKKKKEASKRFNIGTAIRDNGSYYLMDQWFSVSPEPLNPQIDRTIGMKMGSYNKNPYFQRFLPCQGSSSNGNINLEMDLIGQPMMTSNGLVGSVFQQLQHFNNNNPIVPTSHPRQYPFEKRSNIKNGGSQFHMSNNIILTNDDLRQNPPPPPLPNGTIAEEDMYMADIVRDWLGIE